MNRRKIRLHESGAVKDFVSAASLCDFDIDIFYNHIIIDAKSMLGVLGLDRANVLTVQYSGKHPAFEKILQQYAAA